MYFKKIFMDKLGSLSYLIGCPKTKAACVVDPSKTGVQEYLETAEKLGFEITHIFDTSSSANHLNGITELKLRTGADVYYLRNSADMFSHFKAKEGDIFDFGQARIEIINSPRHDPYVNSIRVTDTFDLDSPWMILKKESLFIGDIGKPEEGGAKLSEEIFHFLDCNKGIYDQTASDSSSYNKYSDYEKNSEYAAQSMR
jgi:hypothetical protein